MKCLQKCKQNVIVRGNPHQITHFIQLCVEDTNTH